MALISRNLLVRRGVSVLSDGVAVMVRLGSCQGNCQNPASSAISRHLSLRCSLAEAAPDQRRFHQELPEKGAAVNGAGRPGSRAGVLSRSLAITAGYSQGGPSLMAVRTFDCRSQLLANGTSDQAAGKTATCKRFQVGFARPMPGSSRLRLPRGQRANQSMPANAAFFRPCQGTSAASTRG